MRAALHDDGSCPVPAFAAGPIALPESTALLLIDFQRGFDHPSWGRRNNPYAETTAARLLAGWREAGRPVIHVQHLSTDCDSPFRPGQNGVEFKPTLEPSPGEFVVQKATNNAFIDTGLEALLRQQSITTLVVAGVVINNAVEATVGMAGNLGYQVYVVADATATVDKRDLNGRLWFAEEVQALSLANIAGQYATVIESQEVFSALDPPAPAPC